jgi:hypothetical protein
MLDIKPYVSTGTESNIVVVETPTILESGGWFSVKMNENSLEGITLNGVAVKILDVYNTEESQWTIVNGGDASKDKPKVNVYRKVYTNMLSEDVEYQFRYVPSEGFYEVLIHKLYKHVFIGTGNGAEIAELQDVFGFISQFDRGTAMDPIFMRVDAGTDYYPNKAQISITLPSGTVAGGSIPVVSQFAKKVRAGENSMNGIEIINETRYSTNQPASLCIAEYTGTLGTDDLAFLNIWKTDLGEVRGIRFKYAGNFTANSQSVVRFNRSYARLKLCEIDVSSATVNAGVSAVSVVYWDGENECFDNKVICNGSTEQDLAAYYCGQVPSVSPGLLIEGRPRFAFRLNGPLTVSNCQITDPVSFLVDVFGSGAHLTLTGGSTDVSGVVDIGSYNGYPVGITTASGLTTFTALAPYVGKTFTFGEQIGVSSTILPQFVVDHPTSAARMAFSVGGTITGGGVGHYASTDGIELSGNNSTRHMKITSTGDCEAGSDNVYSMGTAGKRWSVVFSGTPTINTSDEREKQDIADLDDAEKRVAIAIKGLIKKFRFKSAVERKGDDARIHVGVIAQEVKAAFEAEGLDAHRYGILCYDEWETEFAEDGNETKPAGNRYGVRYDELLAFVISSI